MSDGDDDPSTESTVHLGRRNVLRTTGAGLLGAGLLSSTAAGREAADVSAPAPGDDGAEPSPEAVLTVDPSPAEPGGTVTLDGSASSPGVGAEAIEEYAFTVTDAGGATVFETSGEASTATATFDERGEYTATLTVTDRGDGDDGSARTDSTTAPLLVGLPDFPRQLLNPRVRIAGHAWERGYRGRADRSVSLTDSGSDARHGDLGAYSGVRLGTAEGGEMTIEAGADGFDAVSLPEADEVPEFAAWYPSGGGDPDIPRDTSGHGTHVTSIMGGSGRARSLDTGGLFEVLAGGEPTPVGGSTSIERTFTVPPNADGSDLFCAVAGESLDVSLQGPDGSPVASGTTGDNTVDHAAGGYLASNDAERTTLVVEDISADDYALVVRANGDDPSGTGELEAAAVAEMVRPGTDLEGAGDTDAVEFPGATTAAGRTAVHPGVAPGHSIVSMAGYSGALGDFATDAETLVPTFGIRTHNMSWGSPLGVPTGQVQNPADTAYQSIAALARAGVIATHAVANSPGTPTGGADSASAAPEAISVVRTNYLSGIAVTSSGGSAVVTDDGETFRGPDVAAYGQTERAAKTPADTADGKFGSVDGYTNLTGTSMAAPSTSGLAALVMQAMEEDGPEGLDLPSPEGLFDGLDPQDRLGWTLKTKAALLGTASTTAFNALPWHGDQAPAYTPGERDPYEGLGRLNHGAAVDAVSRDLTDETVVDLLGLDVPDDEQAAAGYITGAGSYEVSVDFLGYEGSDDDLTNGEPHLDLYVYDALAPEGIDEPPRTGTPNVVASSTGLIARDGSVTVRLEEDDVYMVAVELVSVPGDGAEQLADAPVDAPAEADRLLFNGADVQAAVETTVEEL